MTVSADVLYGSGAGRAGDFGQGFDAGVFVFAGVFDDCVPVGAAHGGDDTFFFGDALHGIFDNYAVKPFVVGESVGTAAKHKSREGVRFGEIVSIKRAGPPRRIVVSVESGTFSVIFIGLL